MTRPHCVKPTLQVQCQTASSNTKIKRKLAKVTCHLTLTNPERQSPCRISPSFGKSCATPLSDWVWLLWNSNKKKIDLARYYMWKYIDL